MAQKSFGRPGDAIKTVGGIGLRARLVIGMAAVVLLLGVSVIGFTKSALTKALDDELTKRGGVIARSAAQNSADYILTEQHVPLRLMLYGLLDEREDALYAFVLDGRGNLIAHTFQDGFPRDLLPPIGSPSGGESCRPTQLETENESVVDICAPVLGGDAGYVHVGLSERFARQSIGDIENTIMIIVAATLLVGFAVAAAFAKRITGPLYDLVETAEAVSGGDLARRVRVRPNNEVGRLAAAFNAMTDNLSRTLVSRDELERSNRFHKTVLDSMRDSISIIDASDFRIVEVNQRFLLDVNLKRSEVIGRTCHFVTHGSDSPCAARGEACPFIETARNREYSVAEHVHVDANGKKTYAEIHTSPILNEQGRVTRIIHIVRDVTEQRNAEERVKHMAYYDGLTNLPNRVLYRETVTRALMNAERYKKLMAVLFVDLDAFKRINDTLGHAAGDLLLKTAATRIQASVRRSDYVGKADEGDVENTVSRVGGDEFVVLLNDIGRPEDAARVSERVIAFLAKPVSLGTGDVFITASIGIALYPLDGSDADSLIRNADVAMYHAKGHGKNTYQFFSETMNRAAVRRLGIENDLHRAVERSEFFLQYQPKVRVASRTVTSVEALIRWRHPEKGLISPADFIPIAEETGMIVQIGEWVLRTACLQSAAWCAAGFDGTAISVNLSNRQFMQKNLVGAARGIFHETGAQPGGIQLEITESAVMRDPEAAVLTLRELREMGITTAIDDFGTGYSSFGLLRRLPVDCLKIDRSFVATIAQNKDDAAISNAIISMAHSLGLKVVAEGVETKEQLAVLKRQGCDEVQGYLFSRPVNADECMRFFTSGFSE